MELAEIYSGLATHMIKGIMLHEQMADYYDFLGLEGYSACHEYHMYDEMRNYRCLYRYVITHHNMLIPDEKFENPDVIPSSWYNHVRQDVDGNTKKNAVKTGLTAWVEWERKTKKLYEDMYSELMELGEVASAFKLKDYICDVDKELKKAERYHLYKEAVNYDLEVIISEQHYKKEKYKKKLAEVLC